MLELRPNCECCNRDLSSESREAVVCTFECTFCVDCAEHRLYFICPNCGGELLRRPIPPAMDAFLCKLPPLHSESISLIAVA